MKSPNEIKKGLECCISHFMESCNACPYAHISGCARKSTSDALAYIQRLEAELEDMTARYKIADDCAKKKGEMNEKLYAELSTVKAERDAAVEDLETICGMCSVCHACKDRFWGGDSCRGCVNSNHWQWRGVQK